MRNLHHQTAASLLSPGRGILVLDEYLDRCIAPPRASADFLEVAMSASGLGSYVSGVLLEQHAFDRSARLPSLVPGPHAVQLGVRMDTLGTRLRPGGRPVPPLGDVRRALADNLQAGAVFAEWRARVNLMQVARGDVHIHAPALARGAAASQSEGVLPVVTVAMPDLATHSAAVTEAVTANALRALFAELERYDVQLDAMVLRVNMVVAGDAHRHRTTPAEAAMPPSA